MDVLQKRRKKEIIYNAQKNKYKKSFCRKKRKKVGGNTKKQIFIKKKDKEWVLKKLSDFVYSKTKRNKSLNKGGPTIMKRKN